MTLKTPKPIISVVIPVFRVEKYLRECMDSVLAQTFKDFEVILVDDESPDTCPEMCDDFARKYPPSTGKPYVRVIHKKNAGLGMARNTGIDNAQGKYVLFLDSDDTLRSDALQSLMNVVKLHPNIQVVHGSLCRFVKPGRYSSDIHSGVPKIVDGKENLRRTALCCFSSFSGDEPFSVERSSCGALYELKLLNDNHIRFLSERQYISEDYIFNFEVSLHASAIAQIPDTIYQYRVNIGSLTHSNLDIAMPRIAAYSEYIEAMMRVAGFGSMASRYAFGYAAAAKRAQYKYLFRSDASMSLKMQKARRWRELPYFCRMIQEFDPRGMSLPQRLNYKLFAKRKFRMLYALIIAHQSMRNIKGYIGD